MLGHFGVERGVHTDDLGAVDAVSGGVEQPQSRRHMERCHCCRLVEPPAHVVIDNGRIAYRRPTMHQPVSDGIEIASL